MPCSFLTWGLTFSFNSNICLPLQGLYGEIPVIVPSSLPALYLVFCFLVLPCPHLKSLVLHLHCNFFGPLSLVSLPHTPPPQTWPLLTSDTNPSSAHMPTQTTLVPQHLHLCIHTFSSTLWQLPLDHWNRAVTLPTLLFLQVNLAQGLLS